MPRTPNDAHSTQKFKTIFVYFDRSSRRPQCSVAGLAGARAIVFSVGRSPNAYSEQWRGARFLRLASNNEAEGHGGLLVVLAAQYFHSEEVVIRGDS